jgi:hypothetical protein
VFQLGALLCGFSSCGAETEAKPPLILRQEIRPTDTASTQMFRFEPNDVVDSYGVDGGSFRVHFTRAGKNAVPSRDTNGSGIPDAVETVAAVYEDVGKTYQEWGFRVPPRDGSLPSNGGDDRFDVYLLDFGGSADGAFRVDSCPNSEICIGYMVQENDFAGYNYPSFSEATKILGSHEFFHATQAAYDTGQDVVVSEATAVWATERYDPESSDFERFIGAYLQRPDRSLDSAPAGPVPASAYGTALFFQFLSERYGSAIVRELWERLENTQGAASEPQDQANPTWVPQLDALLQQKYQSSFANAFETFATWNLSTGPAANPSVSYQRGADYPAPTVSQATLPIAGQSLRVFYASTQYFRAELNGQTQLSAQLFDDPLNEGDDTQGLVLVAATRKSGRNLWVGRVTQPIDVSAADEVVFAVINLLRSGTGPVLSRRPRLCAGTAETLQLCERRDSQPDAGVDQLPEGPSAPGCGCGMNAAPSALFLFALAMIRGFRRLP